MGVEPNVTSVEACLIAHGLRVCPDHGISSCAKGGYRHLISCNAPVEDIERKVQEHCRQRKSVKIGHKLPNSTVAKEVGRAITLLRGGKLSDIVSDTWCSVRSPTQLLYFCGCKHIQPMQNYHFREHMRAEGNKYKCKLSVWGKSELEALLLEANAFAFCGFRCARATCGRWISRSHVEPDLAKLSYYLRDLKAPTDSEGVQPNESGGTSPSAAASSSAAAEALSDSIIEANECALQSATMEVEASSDVEDSAIIAGAQAESEATSNSSTATTTQSTRPLILLLGFTFRKETNEVGPTYEELLDEARHYYGKDNTQLPGAIRDKARIVRLRDAGFDCFCVSKSNKDENDESMHYYGDFCDRKFLHELRGKLHKHPVQICVDWVYCPIGWDTTHYLRSQFFTKTLPDIASILCLGAIEIESNNQRITRKREKDETVIPSGVIFLPFTLGVVAELFKALATVERKYTVSYLDREQLMVEHPMFAATASISDSDMKLLNKNPRPEDGYATDLFKNIDASASNNIDARQFKSYVMFNCSTETRMIKLTLKDDS